MACKTVETVGNADKLCTTAPASPRLLPLVSERLVVYITCDPDNKRDLPQPQPGDSLNTNASSRCPDWVLMDTH